MPVLSHILDDETREPVEGMSVVVVDGLGNNLSTPVTTGWDGAFTLPDDPLKDSKGKKIKISGPGYETKLIDASSIGLASIFVIPLEGQSSNDELGMHLNEKTKTNKADYTLTYIMGSAALLCFVMAIVIKH